MRRIQVIVAEGVQGLAECEQVLGAMVSFERLRDCILAALHA
jgi:hypothetical protein